MASPRKKTTKSTSRLTAAAIAAKRSAPIADGGKAQSVYLRDADVRRSNKLEYALKESRAIPGRIGLSLVLRAGLKMLADAYDKNPAAALALAKDVAAED